MDLVAKLFALEAENSRLKQALREVRETGPDHRVSEIIDRALKEDK